MEHTRFLEDRRFLQSYLTRKSWKKWYWQDLFRLEYIPGFTWQHLIADDIAPVQADVVAYDAPAPIKTRRIVEKMSGDLMKVNAKRVMNEVQINDYNHLRGNKLVPDSAIMKFIFDDVDFAYNAVQAAREYACLYALSAFTLTYSTTTNEQGVIFETTIDYNLPAARKRKLKTATANCKWGTGTASQRLPITDFMDIREAAEDAGVEPPKYALMNPTSFRLFQKSDEVIDMVQSMETVQMKFVPLNAINAGLRANNLAQIVVIDAQTNYENDRHTLTSNNPWQSGMVTFVPKLPFGTLKYTDPAERTNPPKQVVQGYNNGVLVSKWRLNDPIRELTKGEGVFFPTIPDIYSVWKLNTDANGATGLE